MEATFKFKPGSRVLVIDQSSMHFCRVGWIVGTYREYWEPNASFKYWVLFDNSPNDLYVFDEEQLASSDFVQSLMEQSRGTGKNFCIFRALYADLKNKGVLK